MKVKIPLGSCKLYAKKTYHENQQNEIFKIRDVQNIFKKRPTLVYSICFDSQQSNDMIMRSGMFEMTIWAGKIFL